MLEVLGHTEIVPEIEFSQSIVEFEKQLEKISDDVEKYLETISMKERGTQDQGYRFD